MDDAGEPKLNDAYTRLINGTYEPWAPQKEKIILGPFEYLLGHPGKDVRSQLIGAFNEWLQVPEKSLEIITKAIGMLHTASLLVDDVEDSSVLRRGQPVSHLIFGIPQTLNSANYVYFLALQELMKLNHGGSAIKIFTDELLNLHRGQGMDLFWRDNLQCPSEEEYLEMVSNKTGGLFRLAIKLMMAESSIQDPTPDCLPLVQTISLYFQILDDLLNLSSVLYTERKGVAEDLTEGKFSFPVIHAIKAEPTNMELINILRMKTNDLEVKKYAIGYMEKMGSFEYTKQILGQLEKKALLLVDDLETSVGGNQGVKGAKGVKAILGALKAL